MKTIFKITTLIASTLLIGLFISGCGAASTAIEKRNLEVQTKMSDTVFLEPVSPDKRIVYVRVRNTTDKDIQVDQAIKSSIESNGFTVTNNPDEAYFMIQANVLQVGKTDATDKDSALKSGFGGGVLRRGKPRD